MAGILESLNDRKAYFQELRKNDPDQYVNKMQKQSDSLGRQVGASQEKGTERMLGAMKSKSAEDQNRDRTQNTQDRLRHQESLGLGNRQVEQTKELGYQLGNDMKSVGNNLAEILKQMLALLKKQQKDANGPFGLLGDFLSRRGRGGLGGRGGRGGRRGGRAGRAGGAGAGRAGRDRSGRNSGASTRNQNVLGGRKPGLASRAMGWTRNAAGSVGSAVGGREGAGRLLRRAGAVGAVAAGAVGAYSIMKDDTKTAGEKAQAGANLAGGTAGALAMGAGGAKLGAIIGTAILPGIGTAIGGAIGGIGGGALGFFGGEKIVDKIGRSISGAVTKSGIGDHIGRATALVMSPFSDDARAALVADWKNNILPSWQQTFTPLKDALGGLGTSLSGFMSNMPDTLKRAAGIAAAVAAGPANMVLGAVRNVASFVENNGGAAGRAVVGAGRRAAGVAASALPSSVSQALGFVAAKYESGGAGVATVSTGRGDHGGVSYGKHQLASRNGSMAKFLSSNEGAAYAHHFRGLTPGSAEFSAKYREVVGQDSAGMASAQQQYIVRTHYDPLAAKVANETGLDVNKRGRGVQEAIMSTGVQYGGNTGTVTRALAGMDVNKASDEDIINAIQNYKASNVDSNFKSSRQDVRDGVRRRIENERRDLLAVSAESRGASADVAAAAGTTDNSPVQIGATVRNTTGIVQRPGSPASASASLGEGMRGSVLGLDGRPVMGTPRQPGWSAIGQATPTAPSRVVPNSATVMSPSQAASAARVESAPTVLAARSQSPVQRVNPNTPSEASNVTVTNPTPAPQQQAAAPTQVVQAARGGGGGLSLNDVPVFFPDMSLVPSLLGRV